VKILHIIYQNRKNKYKIKEENKVQVITSKDNEIVKNIRKLKEKKYRDLSNQYMVEGIKLIEEAIEENVNIKKIVVCEECLKDCTIEQKFLYKIAKYDCIYVTSKIFALLTDVVNPQGMLAVIEKENSEDIKYTEDIIIILDEIQDPGNLGTILRTVDSAGLSQIIMSKTSVDAYNPKVVRSTMGAIFRVKIVEVEDLVETLKSIKKHKFKVVATSLMGKESIYDVDYNKKAIIIGNEANGVSKGILEVSDAKMKIPMLGKTESLNASVATGIIVYEYVRRKIS